MFDYYRLLPGYAWAVHSAYEKQLKRREFQVGDVIYSNREAWVRGTLTEGDRLIQVKSTTGTGLDAKLLIALCTNDWWNCERLSLTTRQLIEFLKTDDDAHLEVS